MEEMGQSLSGPGSESDKESLRIREVIRRHFDINGELYLVEGVNLPMYPESL